VALTKYRHIDLKIDFFRQFSG